MKKLLSIMLVLTMALTLLAGCGGSGSSSTPAASLAPRLAALLRPPEGQTLKVAAIETAYGPRHGKKCARRLRQPTPALPLN